MGVLAVGVGKIQEALPFFRAALEANPNESQFWLSYIDALIRLDLVVDAKAMLDQAKKKGANGVAFDQLEQQLARQRSKINSINAIESVGSNSSNPNILDTVNLDGALRLAKQRSKDGQIAESKNIYDNILQKFPKNKKALIALKSLAESSSLVPQDPPSAKLHPIINLYSQGQLQQTLCQASEMLKQFPNSSALYNIAGAANAGLMQVGPALDSYKKAIKINPDFAEAYNNISIVLRGVVFTKPSYALQGIITKLLNSNNQTTPRELSSAAISLLRCEPAIKEILNKHSIDEVKRSLEGLVVNLSEIPLLLRLMSVCPLGDLELEDVFNDLRSALLLSVSETSHSPKILPFQSALALQCFTNEYVYNQSDEETEALVALEAVLEEVFLKGGQPSPQSVLCLASYKALYKYKWCDLLTGTTGIEEVFARQVLEPMQESDLKSDMPSLQEITNKVSSKVRDMYEENPYPRWIHAGLSLDSAPISEIIRETKLKLFDRAINEVEFPDILVAGCGTGQHSISTASRFKNAKVLAVDLSLSSLAYAKRKTKELRIQNIDYMQADILDLGQLDRKFDIIESSGVLHHMQDPMAGWRVLTACLNSGGLMKIGLYSELARQQIIKIREEIKQSGIGSSDLAMKSFRRDLIHSNKDHHKIMRLASDFYSLSEFRDLLFHVHEYRFTIPKIQNCLDELGLKFCGFDTDRIVRNFKLTSTGEDNLYDLDQWNTYEQANPSAFTGMYQFWCQKVV